jgi:hypothetical protein
MGLSRQLEEVWNLDPSMFQKTCATEAHARFAWEPWARCRASCHRLVRVPGRDMKPCILSGLH